MPPDAVVLFVMLFRDGAGASFVPHDAVSRISAAANRPVYGFLDQFIGRGILGGSVYSLSAQGTEVAKLVLRILADPAHSVPSPMEAPTMKVQFDWRQMQRWEIGKSSLPAGSEVWFREPTTWEQYGKQILLVALIIFVQSVLIAWLLFERRHRRRAEVRARDTMSDLMHLNRAATAGELSASIAHEVNQPLASIVANANAAIRWLAAPNINEAEAALKRIVASGHHAADVIASVRAMFKRGGEERVYVQINQLIQNAVSLERIPIERKHVSLQLDLAERLPEVLGDRVQLLQVILNLIRNAVDAMGAVGQRFLRIKTQVGDSGETFWCPSKIPGRGWIARSLPVFSTRFSPPSKKDWASASRSAKRSSKATKAAYGSSLRSRRDQHSISSSRATERAMAGFPCCGSNESNPHHQRRSHAHACWPHIMAPAGMAIANVTFRWNRARPRSRNT